MPRLGAAASGLAALLLVGAVAVIPVFGLLIAPLGALPVLRFQAGGARGVRAWGPVTALLAVLAGAGVLVEYTVPLLVFYVLVVVVPAVSVQAWVRRSWSEGRWTAATVLAATLCCVVGIVIAAAPQPPLEAISDVVRASLAETTRIYTEWGMERGDLELAMDGIQRAAPSLFPGMIVAYLAAVLFWLRPRLPLLGIPVSVGPLEAYRNDDWLAAAFAVFGIAALLLGGTARWIAVNLLVAVLILYFVQGLAMIRAHLARWVGRGLVLRWGVGFVFVWVPLVLCASGVTDPAAGLAGEAMLIVVVALGVADNFFTLRPRADDDGGTE